MIFYDGESECWVSDENDEFKVDMTPEDPTMEDLEFETEEEFWEWYNGDNLFVRDSCEFYEKFEEVK